MHNISHVLLQAKVMLRKVNNSFPFGIYWFTITYVYLFQNCFSCCNNTASWYPSNKTPRSVNSCMHLTFCISTLRTTLKSITFTFLSLSASLSVCLSLLTSLGEALQSCRLLILYNFFLNIYRKSKFPKRALQIFL